MALNVKNPAAEKAVRELMALTGEGQAEAIERAARERLTRLRERRDGAEIDALLTAIRRDFAGADLSTDGLYDDDGLPR